MCVCVCVCVCVCMCVCMVGGCDKIFVILLIEFVH